MHRAKFITTGLLIISLTGIYSAAFAQNSSDTPPAVTAPEPSAPPAAAPPAAPAPVAAPAPAAPAPATVAAPAEPQKLTGLAAWNTIIGNTITGKREGDDFDYYVKADGSIVWLDDGDIETGKWALEGQKICVTFPGEEKECFRIEMTGATINFLDDDNSGFRGTLLKGNPKNL